MSVYCKACEGEPGYTNHSEGCDMRMPQGVADVVRRIERDRCIGLIEKWMKDTDRVYGTMTEDYRQLAKIRTDTARIIIGLLRSLR